MRGYRILGVAVIAVLGVATAAAAAELSPAYLDGRWTTGGAENCARAEHEQTVFRRGRHLRHRAQRQGPGGRLLADRGGPDRHADPDHRGLIAAGASGPAPRRVPCARGPRLGLRRDRQLRFGSCRASRAICAASTWCAARQPDRGRGAGGGCSPPPRPVVRPAGRAATSRPRNAAGRASPTSASIWPPTWAWRSAP